ncbi:hypothetical protein BC834DRAFT_375863 [Gloeopeniophorella convolvens]|nr:hypothetical protein BC834DRAFT_375863 [Gloeopeniophorella convolvens]
MAPTASSNATLYADTDGIPDGVLSLVGPILVGSILSWCLYGLLIMQLYVYYLAFPRDTLWVKLIVYGLFILDSAQSVIITDVAWSILCAGWGKPDALVKTSWGFAMTPLIDALISTWVQVFFAWRVWILGRRFVWKSLTVFIVLLALSMGSLGVAAGIKYAGINDVRRINEIYPMICTWLGGSVLADSLIALSMVYLLWRAKRQARWSDKTGRKLTKLIRSTVETGVLSAAVAVLDLSFFLSSNRNNIHITFAFVISKLYSNALMASLNSRAGVYERIVLPSSLSMDLGSRQITTLQFRHTEGESSGESSGETGEDGAGRARPSSGSNWKLPILPLDIIDGLEEEV